MTQLQAFGFTLLCEALILLLLARHLPPTRVIWAALSASALTHPMAWYVALRLGPDDFAFGVLSIEIAVVLLEAAWYQHWLRAPFVQAFMWSFSANLASYALGWLID